MKGIGYFQNLRNLLSNRLQIFWEFFGNCLGESFRRNFLEEFFGRNFLGGFVGEDSLGGFTSRN